MILRIKLDSSDAFLLKKKVINCYVPLNAAINLLYDEIPIRNKAVSAALLSVYSKVWDIGLNNNIGKGMITLKMQ